MYIDNHPSNPDINSVYVDNEDAVKIGTEYLIQAGHRNILLLNRPAKLSSSLYFKKGYIKTLNKHDIPIREEMIKHNPISIEKTFTQLDSIFSGEDRIGRDDFTAILSLSDAIAKGVYESALKHDFSIPGKYSVVGYDNILYTKYLNPALTTLHQPKAQTGLRSINLLLEQIEENHNKHIQIVLNPELTVRSSVKILP